MAVLLEQWARHKFDHSLKCPDNTTNLVESFNDRIKKLRHKPMFTLLEEIRRKIIETIATRFDLPQNQNGKVCPKIQRKLVKLEVDSRTCHVTLVGRGEYEVIAGRTTFTVNLNTHQCNYRVWEISEIPCRYSIRCILRERKQLEDFVDSAYTIDKYMSTYDGIIYPVPDPTFCE